MQSTDVLLPSSVEELTAVFGEGGDVTVLAGGTILMPEIAAGRLLPGRTILLAHAGLDELALDGDPIRIGATVPIAALTGAPDSALAEAAATIADAEIRAQGTVGGNLCAPAGREISRGDLQAPLIALGARVRSVGAGGERTQSVEEFLADRSGRLVLGVELDRAERRSAYVHMRRKHAHSYTVLAVAVADGPDGLRVAVAGAGETARRCPSVESGRDPEAVLRDVEPRDDALASAWYRTRVLPTLVARALAQIGA